MRSTLKVRVFQHRLHRRRFSSQYGVGKEKEQRDWDLLVIFASLSSYSL